MTSRTTCLTLGLFVSVGCSTPVPLDESGLGNTKASADSGTAGAAGCSGTGLPADVEALLSSRCIACHGATPISGVPTSLTTYADLTAPSKSNPAISNAALAIQRMQDPTKPMPPSPLQPATAAEIAAMQNWVQAGAPVSSCADGGATIGPDPFGAAPTCTSGVTWTHGNRGSKAMNPGQACIACHARGEGPFLSIAGTLYPSAHEPDLCNGFGGQGASIVIIGADGQQVAMTPGSSGNFTYSGFIATPYRAKVVYMGRERAMIEAQTSGDCNACHTQSGSMSAPGRILLP